MFLTTFRIQRLGWLGLLLATWSASGRVADPSPTNRLANYDVRWTLPGRTTKLAGSQAAAVQRMRTMTPTVRVDWDGLLQTPKWIQAGEALLTGPQGEGGAVTAKTARSLPAADPDRPIRAFLEEHKELFGHGAEVLGSAEKTRDYVTEHNGVRTVVWEQHLEGIPVRGAVLMAHVTARGELVNLSSRFVPAPDQAATAGTPKRARLLQGATLGAGEVVRAAAGHVGETLAAADCRPLGVPQGATHRQAFRAGRLPGEAQAQLVWLPLGRNQMRLCWETLVTRRHRGETFRVLLDAETGQLLVRQGLTFDLTDATYRVYTSDSPSPFSPGYAAPTTQQPPLVERSLVTLSALSTNASPLGWIADGDNETRGNNVDAHLDRDADNLPDLPRPHGVPFRQFDYPLDLTQEPQTYGDAATVQLFYWCNWIHDRLYDLGFTEGAGNFQKDNLGRGGWGNDPVLADAQDGSGVNNANFTPMPDGSPPRLQVFLFDGPTPRRDAALDAEVILHEYTHGLSDRLVGGGAGIYELQNSGLAEGWSDFVALSLLSEPADDVDGSYAYGGYMTYLFKGLQQNYYFGIRAYPYSTDLNKNPETFKDIDPAQASPHAAVPMNPTVSYAGSEVHRMGEVWCSALWEARANLIRVHGYSNGTTRILRLVMDGMKFSPPAPTFVQARDAILQADVLDYGGANRVELWRAFAKRGLGLSAQAPDVTTTSGVVEAMDTPDSLQADPDTLPSFTGPVGGPFGPTAQFYTLSNLRGPVLGWTVRQNANWLNVWPLAGSLVQGQSTQVFMAPNDLARTLPAGTYIATLDFSNSLSGGLLSRQVTLRVAEPDQPDFLVQQFVQNDFDLTNSMLTFTPDPSNSTYSVCRQAATALPSSPANAQPLTLWDDSYRLVTLVGGAQVSLFGHKTNAVLIGSNGDVAWEVPSTYTNAAPGFYAQYCQPYLSFVLERLRVSPLYTDLNPETGGTVCWQQFADRLAVTWLGMPEFGTANSNTFQLEWFFDGTIRLTFLHLEARNAIVGLSRGDGLPAGFVNSTFSASPSCVPPLQLLLPERVTEGATGVMGTIQLDQPVPSDVLTNLTTNMLVGFTGPVSSLVFQGTPVLELRSSDTNILSVPAQVTVPPGESRVSFPLQVPEDFQLRGTRRVVVTATFGPDSASRGIAVDDRQVASLSVSVPARVKENAGVLVNRGWVGVDQVPASPIAVELSSDDTNSLVVPASVTIPAGQTSVRFDLTPVDNSRLDGARLVVVTAHVQNWNDDLDALWIEDDEVATLTLTLPARVDESAGLLSGAGQVQLSALLPTNVVVALSADLPNALGLPPVVLIPAGQSGATFDLNPVNDTLLEGPRVVTVTASAPSFPSSTAHLTIEDDEMPSAPVNPSPVHGATGAPTVASLSWSTARAEAFGSVAYDLYFGTNAALSQADYAGSTLETTWPLPPLRIATHYYWQVVVSKDGQILSGPVWEFTTVGLGGFDWATVAPTQQVGVPFPVTLTARDENGAPALGFAGPVEVTASRPQPSQSTILITEVETSTYDAVEFANVSSRPVDVTGWQVALYDWVTWPEPRVSFRFPLGSLSQPGETFVFKRRPVQYYPGVYPTFHFPTLIGWNNNPNGNPVAVLLADDLGNVVDFICAVDADPSQIQHPVPVPPAHWPGAPLPANFSTSLSYQRRGNADHQDASDWTTATNSVATTNVGLLLPFSEVAPFTVSLGAVSTFTNGVWSGLVTVAFEGQNVVLRASDGQGREGLSTPFTVAAENDLSLRQETTPSRATFGQPLTQTLILSNSGPNEATGVQVDCRLAVAAPDAVTLVATTASQGAWSNSPGLVRWEVGALPGGASAQAQLRLLPQAVGWITNFYSVSRAEADPNAANNSLEWTGLIRYPFLSVTNGMVRETQSGFTNLVFPVRLSDPCAFPVGVAFATSDGNAQAGVDYQPTNGILWFTPGLTNLGVPVPVFGNTKYESNKTFTLTLSQPTNALLLYPVASGIVSNDDGMTAVRTLDASGPEGDDGVSSLSFQAFLIAVSGKPASVSYTTVDDTARAGIDYVATSGRLRFAPGTTNQTITVPILGNRVFEPNRRFFVRFSNPSETYIWNTDAVGTIVDDDAAQLHHFAWGELAVTQQVNTPFPLRLTARDASNQVLNSFNGTVPIRARRDVLDVTIGSGTVSWEQPVGASFHDNRLQTLYWSQEIGRAGRLTALALRLLTQPGQVLSNWTIRLKPVSATNLFLAGWESNGWTVAYQANTVLRSNGWVSFPFQTPFDYDGTSNLLVDFSFRNSSYSTDGAIQATRTNQVRALSYRTDSGFGDPLLWQGFRPVPASTNLFPNVRFTLESPVHSAPLLAGPFVNGVWADSGTVLEPAVQMTLLAADPFGPVGESSPFTVAYADADADGLPDDWELAHGLNPKDPTDAGLDPDQDGLTNLQEFQAGTDPHAADSTLRLTSTRVVPGGVRLEFGSVQGKTYRLEASTNLVAGSWSVASSPIPGTGGTVVLTQPTAAVPYRFYRLKLVP